MALPMALPDELGDAVIELIRERLPGEDGEQVGVGLTFQRRPDGLIVVARIKPGSAAEKSRKFGRGQVVKAVNGWSVHGLSPDKVFQMVLGPERTRVQLAVGQKPDNQDEMFTFHPAHQAAMESKVQFEKSIQKTSIPGYVGVSIETGITGKHRVVSIVPGGPASGHGMVRVGDVLEKIDGIEVTSKSNQEVRDMIAGPAGSWVTMELSRPGARAVKLAIPRVEKLPESGDARSALPVHAEVKPDPDGVPRPATVGASYHGASQQHGAFLNDKVMEEVKPTVQTGMLIGTSGQRHLLMEHRAEGVFSKEIDAASPELHQMHAGTVQISLFYAKHLPVKTLFGLTDCYVQATYEGKRMRTRTVRLNLDPAFNTTMRFPAGDCVNAASISVLQVGGIGSDLEIGHVVLPYKDIARGVNKEFALFERDGASVIGLKGQTSVLYIRATADMRENDVDEVEHRRAEREWAAQAMALQKEQRLWPDWMPSQHAHRYGLDPDANDQEGVKEGDKTRGLTLRLDEDYKEAKKHERAFSQHLINDLATATDAKHERFQYVGIEKGSVLASVNVLPSKDPRDSRTAMNIISELTIQTYDPSSKLRRLPCTYTARNAHSHPPRKPPTRPTWGIRNWFDSFSHAAAPPEGPDEGPPAIPEEELGGEQKPVFGATAALPVLNKMSSEAPPQQPQAQTLAAQPPQPQPPKQPVGFFASATVLDSLMNPHGNGSSAPAPAAQPRAANAPEPSTIISNRSAVDSKQPAVEAQPQANPTVSALFNSLMTSFAGRHPFDAAKANQGPCEVKLLVKQGKHLVGPRTRSRIYFCASLLAVGSRLDENVVHQVSKGAHIESLPPEALSRAEHSPLNKYELVAQYRSHVVGVNSDLVTFEWEETVKMRDCIAAVDDPAGPTKEQLKGQPVQLLLTLHGNDVAAGDETLGWTLVPIAAETEITHWFPLMDTNGQIKNIDRQQACIHLSYSYKPMGKKDDDEEEEETKPQASSTVDRSLIPSKVVHAETAPDAEAPQEAQSSKDTASVRSVALTGNWNYAAVKNAVRGVKALAANGYEVVLVGNGDVNSSRKAVVALKRAGLVDEDKGAVKQSNLVFVENVREKAEVAKQLGGLVAVVDREWEALQAVAEEVEDGAQCVLFSPSREGRRKYLEAVMAREAEEAELAALTVELARQRQALRKTELGLARVGVDMRAQSRYTPQEEDPQVRKMVEAYTSEEIRVVESANRVRELLHRTASPLACVPTTRNELGLLQQRKPDGWEEACAALGLDAALVRVYDERPAIGQMVKPSPSDPPPFYPLARSDSQEAMLRLPRRVEAWELAKRMGARPFIEDCGVGITATAGHKGELFVQSVEYGSAAFLSRAVGAGDMMVSVDGEVLLGMEDRDVNRLLRGRLGTVVLLELRKEGEEETQTVVLERKETVSVFRESKGRVLVGLEGVVLQPQIDTDAEKSGRVQITIGTATHLPPAVNVEAMFCLVKISTLSTAGKPEVMRSDLVPVSPPPFASCLFDAKFQAQVDDLAKQKVTVELYWPDPHRRAGTLMGICELSAQQLVAGSGYRWITVLDVSGNPIKGTDGEACKLQLAGELQKTDLAEKLLEQARASQGQSLALAAQDTVGVSLVLNEDFNSMVGYDHQKRFQFAQELRLDLAAALYTTEERFVVCGLQPGSVVAHVNIVQDVSGADPREPRALAKLLSNQVVDKASPLHWAQTTRNCVSISTAPAFRAPKGAAGQQQIPAEKPGGDRELAPKERVAGSTLKSQAERDRQRLLGFDDSIGDSGPLLGMPERALTHKERQGASLNALAAGMMRSKEPGLFAEPAVVSLTFSQQTSALDTPMKQAQIHSDLADVLYLPIEAIDIGGCDAQRRSLDVVVFPFSSRAAERIRDNMELARKMVPGVQHMIAAQLVSQVFDKSSQLWQLPGLDGIEWAQVIHVPGDAQTKQVVSRMKGEDKVRDPTGAVGATAAAARQQQQAAIGEGIQSPAPPKDKVWVASPTLGMVWEELVDRTGEPYWVNHKEKLVSYSHPKYHWPLPAGWTQHVDDRRRVYYSAPGKKRTQWEHPCSPSVVYGVVIQGYSEAAVQLRDWVRSHGWKDITSKLAAEPWAKDLQVEEEPTRTRVVEFPPGQTQRIIAAYSFKMVWDNVPVKERGMQPLPPPAVGEDFVTLDANMVALMMTQYPAGYYILFKPSLLRIKTAPGFTTVWVTCKDVNGEVIHRKVTVVGRDSRGAHPGFQGRYEGWAITEVEEPWKLDPAQMLERGLMYSSIAVLLQTHPEEFVIRVDPDQEIPSCRFVRKTWGSQEGAPDLVEDVDALARPLVRQKEVQAAKEQEQQRQQLAHMSPEVQDALLTMGATAPAPQEDAIGGIAEQEAAAFAAGLTEVDILPFDERPGFSEISVHLRRGALKAGNIDGLSGIGVVLQALHNPDDPYMIVEVEPTGPAGISQQVEVGDILLAVDSYQTKNLTLADVIARIKGPPFAPVTLFLRRKDADKAPGASFE